MALTPLHSSQYLIATTKPIQGVSGAEWNGTLKASIGTLTFTAAGTGTAKMIILPAGKKIIYPYLSHIFCPAGTATADIHVGYSAYKTRGVAVAADDNAFLDNADLGAGEIDQVLDLPDKDYFILDSDGPVDIEVLIDTANSPAAGELNLVLVWASVGK
jgi:hypothetical protein